MTATSGVDLTQYVDLLSSIDPFQWSGEGTEMVGLPVESRGPPVAAGNFCEGLTSDGRVVRTQLVGFRNGRVPSIPLEETDGIQLGDKVVGRAQASRVA